MTGGLHGGELIILAARPSMGKTALALNIAQHVATHPKMRKPVAVFSLEMSSSSLLNRLVCSAARVDQHKFRAGFLNQDERRKLQFALADLTESPLLSRRHAGRASDGRARETPPHAGERRAQPGGDRLSAIDEQPRAQSENRNQEVSAISRGLKLMAKDLNVPFLVLSQLSRASETRVGDHKPQLSDLRDSGSIEQDADLVTFIFREEVYKRDREDIKGLADLIIAKQRNGPIGTVPLRFLGQYTRFENRVDDLPEEPMD